MLCKHLLKLFTFPVIATFFLILPACKTRPSDNLDATVSIKKSNGHFKLYRNGKPFIIKGVAGHSNLAKLKKIGGNTIRTYDTLNLKPILDDAAANGLAVIVGIPLPESEYSNYTYNKPLVANKQFRDIKRLVNRFKNHPALLIWCVGNELDFSPNIKHLDFYREFNKIVEMIHRDDPDHPVTTTMNNFYPKNLICISLFTNIDILSTNYFKSLDEIKGDLQKVSLIWGGPFIVSEWGIDGPWRATRNAWGARIEETSQKKAERYRDVYQFMPSDNPGFLGSLVFYWGSKQETTHTWFSMFDEKGRQAEAVGVMENNWTGKNSQPQSPDVDFMLINSKGAMENIILKPGVNAEATLRISDPDSTAYTIWEIYPEDWFYPGNEKNDKKLKPIVGSFHSTGYTEAKFKAPAIEGPYRIFATVYNRSGSFASCNTPFYVVSN
jgi:hypothetical protein